MLYMEVSPPLFQEGRGEESSASEEDSVTNSTVASSERSGYSTSIAEDYTDSSESSATEE